MPPQPQPSEERNAQTPGRADERLVERVTNELMEKIKNVGEFNRYAWDILSAHEAPEGGAQNRLRFIEGILRPAVRGYLDAFAARMEGEAQALILARRDLNRLFDVIVPATQRTAEQMNPSGDAQKVVTTYLVLVERVVRGVREMDTAESLASFQANAPYMSILRRLQEPGRPDRLDDADFEKISSLVSDLRSETLSSGHSQPMKIFMLVSMMSAMTPEEKRKLCRKISEGDNGREIVRRFVQEAVATGCMSADEGRAVVHDIGAQIGMGSAQEQQTFVRGLERNAEHFQRTLGGLEAERRSISMLGATAGMKAMTFNGTAAQYIAQFGFLTMVANVMVEYTSEWNATVGNPSFLDRLITAAGKGTLAVAQNQYVYLGGAGVVWGLNYLDPTVWPWLSSSPSGTTIEVAEQRRLKRFVQEFLQTRPGADDYLRTNFSRMHDSARGQERAKGEFIPRIEDMPDLSRDLLESGGFLAGRNPAQAQEAGKRAIGRIFTICAKGLSVDTPPKFQQLMAELHGSRPSLAPYVRNPHQIS